MPVVQRYGERRVSTAALPGVRKTAAATALSEGAGVEAANEGRALQAAQVGADVTRLGTQMYAQQQADNRRDAEEARLRAIDLKVIESKNAIAAKKLELLEHPQTGALNQKGKASFETPEKVDEDFNKFLDELAAEHKTPEGQLAFARLRQSEQEEVAISTRRHVAKEMQSVAASETKARVENGINESIKANTTPAANGALDVRRGRLHMQDTIDDFKRMAPMLGIDDEEVEQQVRAITTRTHEGTIRQLLADGKTQSARVYFEETGKEIDAERHDEIKGMLKAGTTKAEAQKQTEAILSKGGTLEEQLTRAREIVDPDVQDDVVARLEHRNAVKRGEERQQHEDMMVDIANTVRAAKSADGIPPAQLAKLTGPQHSMFIEYAKTLVETRGVGKTDPKKYQSLYGMASSLDPKVRQAFIDRDLTQDINGLSVSDHGEMVRLQATLRKGDQEAADKALAGYQTQQQIVDGVLRSARLDPTPKEGSAAAQAITQLRTAIDQQVSAWKQENPGKTMSSDQMRKIGDDMMKQTTLTTERGWSGALGALFPTREVQKRIGAVTLTDMTPADRTEAAEYLRSKGRPVNDDAIVNVHRRFLALEASKPK